MLSRALVIKQFADRPVHESAGGRAAGGHPRLHGAGPDAQAADCSTEQGAASICNRLVTMSDARPLF